jgi:hypothetical protein
VEVGLFQLSKARSSAPLKLLSSLAIAFGILFSSLALVGSPASAASVAPNAAAAGDAANDFAIGGIIKDGDTPVAGVKFTITGKNFSGNGVTGADGR